MKPTLKWSEIEKGKRKKSLRRRKSDSLSRYPAKQHDACPLEKGENKVYGPQEQRWNLRALLFPCNSSSSSSSSSDGWTRLLSVALSLTLMLRVAYSTRNTSEWRGERGKNWGKKAKGGRKQVIIGNRGVLRATRDLF